MSEALKHAMFAVRNEGNEPALERRGCWLIDNEEVDGEECGFIQFHSFDETFVGVRIALKSLQVTPTPLEISMNGKTIIQWITLIEAKTLTGTKFVGRQFP